MDFNVWRVDYTESFSSFFLFYGLFLSLHWSQLMEIVINCIHIILFIVLTPSKSNCCLFLDIPTKDQRRYWAQPEILRPIGLIAPTARNWTFFINPNLKCTATSCNLKARQTKCAITCHILYLPPPKSRSSATPNQHTMPHLGATGLKFRGDHWSLGPTAGLRGCLFLNIIF